MLRDLHNALHTHTVGNHVNLTDRAHTSLSLQILKLNKINTFTQRYWFVLFDILVV